jgi:hypothetical protein
MPQNSLVPLASAMGLESERPKRRGYLNPALVVRFSFWTMTMCVLIAVVVSILAIWQFAGTDALWRTVATCAVIAAGTLAFSWINGLFDTGQRDSENDGGTHGFAGTNQATPTATPGDTGNKGTSMASTELST